MKTTKLTADQIKNMFLFDDEAFGDIILVTGKAEGKFWNTYIIPNIDFDYEPIYEAKTQDELCAYLATAEWVQHKRSEDELRWSNKDAFEKLNRWNDVERRDVVELIQYAGKVTIEGPMEFINDMHHILVMAWNHAVDNNMPIYRGIIEDLLNSFEV